MRRSFFDTRARTESLCSPLEPDDFVIQSMPDASPVKWHLAHTTWFVEEMVLARFVPGYVPFHPSFRFLFNSYYESLGERVDRARRGTIARPTIEEVFRYRKRIDEAVAGLPESAEVERALELAKQHEQQHQELLLTDLKHAFSLSPLKPAYQREWRESGAPPAPLRWNNVTAGVGRLGADAGGFSFDNERPAHDVLIHGFELASRLVTNGEYLEFMTAGGYARPAAWLSDGWAAVRRLGWRAPLYWEHDGRSWSTMTLAGPRALDEREPVCHVSYYEADAYARWRGARLPTEAEWETVARGTRIDGNLLESGRLHPAPAGAAAQLWGDAWEWTSSAYAPYPGFVPFEGALGEYNGKFMCNQLVLRGGSCVTPASHLRATYRNFFGPEARWQFSGIRLAR